MKKTLALLLAIVFAVALFTGCGTSPSTVKTGLAILTSIAKSADAGEKDGVAQADSLIVAVTVSADGKIVSCVIDQAQTKVNFNTKGELVTALDSTFMTKNELGADYGMGKISTIGKEWNEQAAAFAQYVIGKTADEVKGIAVDAEGKATSADLTASVTVHVTDFIAGVQKAVANAQDLGAVSTDKLGVGTATNIEKSQNAAADADGLAQIYSTYTAITTNADGVITSCIVDASQSNVNFDMTGKITTDLTIALQTKNELGGAYGMKKASSIGKEWNEQATAFAAYVTGKTTTDVAGTAVSEGYAGDADLKASVTVHITDFLAIIAKAAA